jgi:hypothetical protein
VRVHSSTWLWGATQLGRWTNSQTDQVTSKAGIDTVCIYLGNDNMRWYLCTLGSPHISKMWIDSDAIRKSPRHSSSPHQFFIILPDARRPGWR